MCSKSQLNVLLSLTNENSVCDAEAAGLQSLAH